MSLIFAALNPNISNKQLVELMDHSAKCNERLMKVFEENLEKINGGEAKLHYMNVCIPVMLQMMFI